MKDKAYLLFIFAAGTFLIGGFRLLDRGENSGMYWGGAVLMLVMAWVSYKRYKQK